MTERQALKALDVQLDGLKRDTLKAIREPAEWTPGHRYYGSLMITEDACRLIRGEQVSEGVTDA